MNDDWRDTYDEWKLASPYEDEDDRCPCCDGTGTLWNGFFREDCPECRGRGTLKAEPDPDLAYDYFPPIEGDAP